MFRNGWLANDSSKYTWIILIRIDECRITPRMQRIWSFFYTYTNPPSKSWIIKAVDCSSFIKYTEPIYSSPAAFLASAPVPLSQKYQHIPPYHQKMQFPTPTSIFQTFFFSILFLTIPIHAIPLTTQPRATGGFQNECTSISLLTTATGSVSSLTAKCPKLKGGIQDTSLNLNEWYCLLPYSLL